MDTSVALGSRARQRAPRILAPLEAVGVVFQGMVMVYVGIAGGILDLISHAAQALLPIDRINAQIERVARFVAPKVLADERDWPILPVLAAISVLAPASVALQIYLIGLGVPWIVACLIHHAVLLGAGGRR